ncbi:MAG TPA: tRNA pseudouridine(38-40) synthase TruA [Drouetiella sp.]
MRVAAQIQYSGKKFAGSQYQAGHRTVQAEIEKALSTYFRVPTKALLSGRTDSGVHAAGQIIHFDVEQDDVELWRLCWALNGILPHDISVERAQIVPGDFHARFSARKREYVYRILNRPQRSALLKDTHFFVYRPLDVELMKSLPGQLLGSHDFVGFRSTNSDKTSTICDVMRAELLNKGEGELEFWIAANHFVYNMVRIIVGTLVDIGLGKRAPESFAEALNAGDRNFAGPTAPPWGLTLNSVEYPEAYALFESNS